MLDFKAISINLMKLRERVETACHAAGRAVGEVRLLPITKTHPVGVVDLLAEMGFEAVGENRVQEVAGKKERCRASLRWELVGHLQSNKARQALDLFDRIQSVDRLKLIAKLGRLTGESGKALPVLLQVNTGEDPGKEGFDPREVSGGLEACLEHPSLVVEGLMTVAPLDQLESSARRSFAGLRECRDQLEARFGIKLPSLSMGMSGDLEWAIAEGSTEIRIGSALLGHR